MIFLNFQPSSKVWIYTASKDFNSDEIPYIDTQIGLFCSLWTAHDVKLKAGGALLFNRLLVLVVDESQTGASGCSIDKSVNFVKQLGAELNCDFLIRNLVGIQLYGKYQWVDFKEIPRLLENQEINSDTLVIDQQIKTLAELEKIEKPLSETWLSRYLKQSV